MQKKKPIYIEVPESEYVRFKVFAALHQVSMQRLIRRSVIRYIEQVKQDRVKGSNPNDRDWET